MIRLKVVKHTHTRGHPLTAKEKRDFAKLAMLPDDQVDTSDIPELPPEAWKNAAGGKFYRAKK